MRIWDQKELEDGGCHNFYLDHMEWEWGRGDNMCPQLSHCRTQTQSLLHSFKHLTCHVWKIEYIFQISENQIKTADWVSSISQNFRS